MSYFFCLFLLNNNLTTNLGYVGAVTRRGGESAASINTIATAYTLYFNPVLEEQDYLIIYWACLTTNVSGVYNLSMNTDDFTYDDVSNYDNNQFMAPTVRITGAGGGGGTCLGYLRATHQGQIQLQYYIPSGTTNFRWRVQVIRLK